MKLSRVMAWIGLAAFCVAVAIAQASVITRVEAINVTGSYLKFQPSSSRAALRSSVRERLSCSPSSDGHLIDAVNSKIDQVFNGQGR